VHFPFGSFDHQLAHDLYICFDCIVVHPAEAYRGDLSGDGEPWFYFCPRQEREARGGRPSRTTPSGYWKAAGTPGLVYAADGRPIGTRKTMVFYRGRAPAGAKTKWKLNEYKALEEEDEYAAAAHAAAPAPTFALQVIDWRSIRCSRYHAS
jgi:hypothetical protein